MLLAACGGVSKRWDPQAYTVKSGDTLYSIAWRYEKDFRQVARLNDIHPPYAIYPGQRLRMQAVDQDGTQSQESHPQVLNEPKTGKVIVIEERDIKPVVKKHKKPLQVVVRKNDTLYSIARREGYSHHQLARWNHLRSPYPLKPGQTLRLTPPQSALGGVQTAATAQTEKTSPVVMTKPLKNTDIKEKSLSSSIKTALPVRVERWQWPVKGRVLKTYKANDTSRKGIRITGKQGQQIKAAAAGTVVYSGNGLINYGNLVIIKHSHSFLSAYAYNQTLKVKEGESVDQGQVIALMGKLESKPQLHFEIRRNGKPVNPLSYLPKR